MYCLYVRWLPFLTVPFAAPFTLSSTGFPYTDHANSLRMNFSEYPAYLDRRFLIFAIPLSNRSL